jgi:peptidoglycan-N-acetylglucosamine deacetylase
LPVAASNNSYLVAAGQRAPPLDLTLTFDNGPEPETTRFILDVLARRSIPTTFFVVGNKLSTSEGRELARRAHEEGHWIGNHTWSHSVPLGLLKDPSAIGAEIRETQDAIGALAHPHRFFRPFGQGGNLDERLLNPVVVDALTAERMSCVLWNAIPGDWKEPDGWVDRALAQCLYEPGQSWCCMTFPLVLCATLNGSWTRQPSWASACGRISRRSAYQFSMGASFGRSPIFSRRRARSKCQRMVRMEQ